MVDAMVDSGAKNSVMSEELLRGRSSFSIRSPSSYRNIDGSAVGNVVGETSITVRYGGVVVDLDRVVVVRTMMFPVVLGVDWIVRSGATIKGLNGKAEVTVPGQDVWASKGEKSEASKKDT